MIEEIEKFEDGKIKIIFDQNNPFVKMAVEIFNQFLLDEGMGVLNATTTFIANVKLLHRTFPEERETMVIENSEQLPRFGLPAYERFKVEIK